ncbi:hypothetical protein GCM10022245_54270 [Streptomyces mayteni]
MLRRPMESASKQVIGSRGRPFQRALFDLALEEAQNAALARSSPGAVVEAMGRVLSSGPPAWAGSGRRSSSSSGSKLMSLAPPHVEDADRGQLALGMVWRWVVSSAEMQYRAGGSPPPPGCLVAAVGVVAGAAR